MATTPGTSPALVAVRSAWSRRSNPAPGCALPARCAAIAPASTAVVFKTSRRVGVSAGGGLLTMAQLSFASLPAGKVARLPQTDLQSLFRSPQFPDLIGE